MRLPDYVVTPDPCPWCVLTEAHWHRLKTLHADGTATLGAIVEMTKPDGYIWNIPPKKVRVPA